MEASHFQNFHLFMAMAAASRDVNKWKRNLTQEMSTEPEDESEPDEPEFETSFIFQQEGDIVAVYNVEDFFISKVTRVISEEEAIVSFLEKVAVKMELLCTGGHALKITLKSPLQLCFSKNLQLAPSSLSPGTFVLCLISQEFIWQISSTQMLFTGKSPVDRVN